MSTPKDVGDAAQSLLDVALRQDESRSPAEDFYTKQADRYPPELRKEELTDIIQYRKAITNRLTGILIGWLISDMVLVYLLGFGLIKVSDTIVIVLLSTITASILGLIFIVVRFFFSKF